jgi:erythromycin esterase-like protein
VDLEDGGTVFVDDDSKLEPAPTPRSHWLDGVLEAIAAPAEVFLLGESTHGTRDYYALRFELVQSLIELKGVSVVAIEGDCVAAARVDSYVRGTSSDRTAEEALRGFTGGRGTTPWLWRNKEVVHFVEWLRERNASSAAACGFAGLDLFSARESARMVVNCVDHGPRNPTHLIAFHTGGRISRIGGPATKPRCGG